MKKGLLIGTLSVLIISGCSLGASTTTPQEETDQPTNAEEQQEKATFAFETTSHDFGVIKQSAGVVSHDFSFTYNGDTPIEVTGVPTSCACTSATVSPTKLQPGDTGVVTVKFNPNLHAEPEGRFFKTASLVTEPAVDEMPEVKIRAEIDLDLGPEAFELQSDHNDDEDDHEEANYNSITPEQFSKMMQEEEFFLVDTHIPEQEHITGTDAFIPYNDIAHYEDELPADKDAKIVVYCRSGSMSRAAAYSLAEHGYTNVYDLLGGKIAYDEYQSNQ